MRSHVLALPLLLACTLAIPYSQSAAQAAAPVDSRLAAQNALFEEYYQNRMKKSPTLATTLGDYRYNDRLTDYSLAEIEREQAENDVFLGRLKGIPTDGFSEQDRLSHNLLLRVLGDNREYRDLKSRMRCR